MPCPDAFRPTGMRWLLVTVFALPMIAHAFTLGGIDNAEFMENTTYTSPIPAVSGNISGGITYSLQTNDVINPFGDISHFQALPVFSGMNGIQILAWLVANNDSALFNADPVLGVVSMPARWAEPPLDKSGNNIHNVILLATDGTGNQAAWHWQVTLLEEPPLNFNIVGISDASIYEHAAYTSPQPIITDRYLGTITYSLEGPDAHHFSVNSSTGIVTMSAKDYDNPLDQTQDNNYEVTLVATDIKNNQARLSWTVTILDLPALNFTLQPKHETVQETFTYQSTPPSISGSFRPPLSYYLGGEDAHHFFINKDTGVIRMNPKWFSHPEDTDGDNIYRVTLHAVDRDNNLDSADWTVTVKFYLYRDSDGDGVPDVVELAEGTDPYNHLSYLDTNGNRIPDYLDADADSDTIANIYENLLHLDPYGDNNGNGLPNYLDPYDRGDGQAAECTLTTLSNFPDSQGNLGDVDICDINYGLDPLWDQDQDGVPNHRDWDSDGDMIPDIIEARVDANGIPIDTDGDGIPDFLDIDSDGDGIPDIVENMKYSVDTNGNGIPDVFDAMIHGFTKTTRFQGDLMVQGLAERRIVEALEQGKWVADFDGDGIPNYLDLDSDGDGIPDALEGTLGRDTLDNGIDDMYDVQITGGVDERGDGIDDAFPCLDTNGNGHCDFLNLDSDGDCISDFVESGATGEDLSLSGYDDAFDACFDEDGKHDGIHSACLRDSDGDGVPDHRDLDSDNDGITDVDESGGIDTNRDGMCDPGSPLITDFNDLPDTDGDGIPDYLDLDSTGDGVFDIAGTKFAAFDSNNDGRVDMTVDADNDGIDDSIDSDPTRFGLMPVFDEDDPGFCSEYPNHPDCEEEVDCDADPTHPDCNGSTDPDCDADPNHPDCDGNGGVDCDANPSHPDCDNDNGSPAGPGGPGGPGSHNTGTIKTAERGAAGLLLIGLLGLAAFTRRKPLV